MPSLVTLVKGVAAAAFSFTSNVAENDTVVIGDRTYTFKATPAAANDVDIGVDLDTSIENLRKAINLEGTPGTEYHASTTINEYVSAVADTVNDELDLTARFPGVYVNGVRLAATSPGANDITANGATFGQVTGATKGSGEFHSASGWVQSLLDNSQINADVIFELHKLTEAAD